MCRIINSFSRYCEKGFEGKKQIILVIIYFFLITLDLFTTWLASPDLKYESNLIVKEFKLKWPHIIILASVFAVGLSLLFIVFSRKLAKKMNNFVYPFDFRHDTFLRFIISKEILPTFIVTSAFYSHIFISSCTVVNNYLNHIYLNKQGSPLINIATDYVKMETFFYPYLFLFIDIITILLVVLYLARRYYKLFQIYNLKVAIPPRGQIKVSSEKI